jgi:RNA polymerase sigma factor (sigma-70 family)
MSREEYVIWVEQAQAGDLAAFSHLVETFQDRVMGAAFGWLGDLESARDVSQETFLDAYAHLGNLREPAAFPAWLRRIVLKHCDRQTRRRAAPNETLEEDSAVTGETPEDEATRAERASGLRLAVGRLPPAERIVVALTCLAELTGPESAEFLELPLPTIKKRLRNARARLRMQGETLMPESLNTLRPSGSCDFTDVVTFFLAIRQGNHTQVRQLLGRSPELADAVQEWGPDLVTDGVLPFASRATALLTAVERDDGTMLELLLDAGADVDGRCACATGESPVWAATLLDRPRLLRILLERGADPNRPSASGTIALHVAAMRGHRDCARLLLDHGADQAAEDARGLTAADWAHDNGHHALAEMLARQPDGGRVPTAAASTPPQAVEEVLFTGIKALDLFCPLPRGGLVRIPFMAGVGMVVLLGELCERITRSPRGHAIWTGFAQRPFDVTDWRTEMAELGILPRIDHSLADMDASADERRSAFDAGLARALTLRARGLDVLLVLLADHGFEGDLEAAFPTLLDADGPGSITTLMITPFPEREDATWRKPTPPFAAQLRLDRPRARRGLFPAVHPALSWSSALGPSGVGAEHARIAALAGKLLADYAEEDPELSGIECAVITDPHFASQERAVNDSGPTDRQDAAVTLLQYLAQPFFVAEPFTDRRGQWVDQRALLAGVDAILHG